MKTFSGILAMALSLCLLLSLLMVAPLGAGAPSIKAPEAELLWDEGTEHDVADLATGDLNGDGKDDVVSLSPLNNTLVAWSGDDGSVLWADESMSGYAVAVGDITGDDVNEVIAGGWDEDFDLEGDSNFGIGGGYVINVYLANGELDWSYPTNNEIHDIELGDVDDDGIDDIVACNDVSSSHIYALKGNETFPEGWPTEGIEVGGEVVDLALGQLDGIGGVDIAAIGDGNGSTVYVYNSTSGLLWSNHEVRGRSVEIGDVDGDGDNEVVTPYYDSPPTGVPNSGFGETPLYGYVLAFDGDDGGEPLYTFQGPQDKVFTDIELGDLDGEPGVEIAAITGNNNLTLFAIDIDSSDVQEMWRYYIDWPIIYYGESLKIGDVDRDYKNEVVAASSVSPHKLFAFDGIDKDGDGQGDAVWYPYEVSNEITDVELGDLDGDGDLDVAFGTTGGNTVYAIAKQEEAITPATGSGTVYIDSDPSAIGNPTAIDPATLPDEGKPDISFPYGMFSFNISGLDNGESCTVTFTLPGPLPTSAEFWKFGPTLADPTDHWYQLDMGDNDGDNVITIELVDGGTGDDDLTANGTIIDDGGPGYYEPVGGEAVEVGSSSMSALQFSVVIAVVWTIALLLFARRRQQS